MAPFTYRLTRSSSGSPNHQERLRFAEAAVRMVSDLAHAAGVTELVIDNPMVGGFFSYDNRFGRAERKLAELFAEGPTGFHDGASVPPATWLGLLRSMLALEGPWCRLSTGDGFFVHCGDRDELYVSGDGPPPAALPGVFVEVVDHSPYRPELDEPSGEPPADEAFWRRLGGLVAEAGAVLVEERWAGNARRWHRPTSAEEVAALRGALTPRALLLVWPDASGDIGAVRAAVRRAERLELIVQQEPDGSFDTGRIAEPWMGREDRPHLQIPSGPGRRAALVPLGPDGPGPLLTARLPDPDGVLRARWRTNRTRADRVRELLWDLRVGDVVTGTVATGLHDIGVYVDLDLGTDGEEGLGHGLGFLRVPEMSWQHFDSVDEVVPVGRRIRAEVLHVELDWEQVSLSLKALTPDPYRQLPAPGEVMAGVVTHLAPFGVFVRVAPGAEGLLHLSDLAGPDGLPPEHPEEVLTVGEEVRVTLLDVDLDRRRITLALPDRPGTESS